MSSAWKWTVAPAADKSAAVFSSACALRAQMLTAAPSCASFEAMALPMPRLAPVTSATWPERRPAEAAFSLFILSIEFLPYEATDFVRHSSYSLGCRPSSDAAQVQRLAKTICPQ